MEPPSLPYRNTVFPYSPPSGGDAHVRSDCPTKILTDSLDQARRSKICATFRREQNVPNSTDCSCVSITLSTPSVRKMVTYASGASYASGHMVNNRLWDGHMSVPRHLQEADRSARVSDHGKVPRAAKPTRSRARHSQTVSPETTDFGSADLTDISSPVVDVEGESIVGSNPPPDPDVVDEIGRSAGLTYEDGEPLQFGVEEAAKDDIWWELNPASSEDYEERQIRTQTARRVRPVSPTSTRKITKLPTRTAKRLSPPR